MTRFPKTITANRMADLVRLDLSLDEQRQGETPDSSRALFIPEHYEPNYAYPLVVWLHGSGADEWQLTAKIEALSLRNYLVVAPRGLRLDRAGSTDRGWGWPNDSHCLHDAEERIFACIESVQCKYHVHPERLFLAGADSGGTMAFRTAMSYPSRFAGVASLGGAFPDPRQTPLRQWNEVRRLPVFLAVAGESTEYPPEKARQDLRLFCVAGLWSISLREYRPCSHPLIARALADLNRWIMEHLHPTGQPQPNVDQESPCL
ncbi:MAG: alpha/beta hydrolase [Thermoguttaceae bacterium]